MTTAIPTAPEPVRNKAAAPTPSNAEALMQILAGHLAAKYLMAANRLGVFETLAATQLTLPSLAHQTGLPVRTLRILVRPLLNIRLLECENGLYRNGPAANACLAGLPGADLRAVVAMWDGVLERQWTHFLDALRTDDAACGWNDLTGEECDLFDGGIAALTGATASALADGYDFSRHTSVLDLGGGTGAFLAAVIKKHPRLRATLFERPLMAAKMLAPGITFIAGDLRSDRIPANHEAVLLANVLHLFKPSDNVDLLRRIRQVSKTGTRLLLVDFWMERDDRTPEFGALLAGEFLIASGGDAYGFDDATGWLERTCWRYVGRQRLTPSSSLIVAEAP